MDLVRGRLMLVTVWAYTVFDSVVDEDNNDSNDLWRCFFFNCIVRVSARKKKLDY